jgi:hypothetical protein
LTGRQEISESLHFNTKEGNLAQGEFGKKEMVRWFLVLLDILGGPSGQKTYPRYRGVANLAQGAFNKVKYYCSLCLTLPADPVEKYQTLRVDPLSAALKNLKQRQCVQSLRTSEMQYIKARTLPLNNEINP